MLTTICSPPTFSSDLGCKKRSNFRTGDLEKMSLFFMLQIHWTQTHFFRSTELTLEVVHPPAQSSQELRWSTRAFVSDGQNGIHRHFTFVCEREYCIFIYSKQGDKPSHMCHTGGLDVHTHASSCSGNFSGEQFEGFLLFVVNSQPDDCFPGPL